MYPIRVGQEEPRTILHRWFICTESFSNCKHFTFCVVKLFCLSLSVSLRVCMCLLLFVISNDTTDIHTHVAGN